MVQTGSSVDEVSQNQQQNKREPDRVRELLEHFTKGETEMAWVPYVREQCSLSFTTEFCKSGNELKSNSNNVTLHIEKNIRYLNTVAEIEE